MRRGALGAAAVLAGVLAAGCTITTHVEPVPERVIPSVCVQENGAVWSKEFLPTLREQLGRHGIETTVFQGERPPGCRYHLEYEAQWKWDMAVYLAFTDIRLYEDGVLIGRGTYDARGGSGRLDKFGRGDEKLARLLDEVLASVNRALARSGG
jgi:hypothetical protein